MFFEQYNLRKGFLTSYFSLKNKHNSEKCKKLYCGGNYSLKKWKPILKMIQHGDYLRQKKYIFSWLFKSPLHSIKPKNRLANPTVYKVVSSFQK